MDPVFGRKVIKRQQHVPIFCQTLCRLRILHFIGSHKVIEGLLRCGATLGHPDLVQGSLGFGLDLWAVGSARWPSYAPSNVARACYQRLAATLSRSPGRHHRPLTLDLSSARVVLDPAKALSTTRLTHGSHRASPATLSCRPQSRR